MRIVLTLAADAKLTGSCGRGRQAMNDADKGGEYQGGD